jgi:hypothetical protein
MLPECTATCCVRREDTTIPVTPEVAAPVKNKPKRAAKPKAEQPENSADFTIGTHPAPEVAPTRPDPSADSPRPAPTPPATPNGSPAKPVYEWDRTPAEALQQQEEERIRKTPFPLPQAKTLPFPQFCEYWNALIQQPISRYARLYIHRWFPACLPVEREDSLGMKRETFPGEKKLTAEDGPLSEQKLLDAVGVGDYTIRLNDTRRAFDQQTIVHCEKFCTMRDYDHYPPNFDIERLDWDDESNQVYIKFAQSRGILRRDDEKEKERTDMATEAVLTQLLQQNKQLTDQVVNSKPVPVAAPAPTPPPKSDNGEGGAFKAVADLAIAVMNRPQPAAAPASDPMAIVQGVVSMVQSITPKPDTSAAELAKEVVKGKQSSDDRMYQLQKEQLDLARQELKEARAAVTPVAVTPPPTLAQQFQDLEAVMGAAKRVVKGGSSNSEEESSKPSNIDKWLDAAPLIAPIAQSLIGGIFQTIHFGFQTWQQISYNNALIKNGAEPKPPMTTAKSPEPGQPAPPQGPQPTAEQQAQQQQLQLILGQVAKLVGPLNRALQNSKTGAEFAEMVIEFTEEGRADYDRIRNVGETLTRIGMQVPGTGIEQFKAACGYLFQQFPAFYQKVANLPTFGTFLEEFYNFDEISAAQEEQS